jgi:hypothetical protein
MTLTRTGVLSRSFTLSLHAAAISDSGRVLRDRVPLVLPCHSPQLASEREKQRPDPSLRYTGTSPSPKPEVRVDSEPEGSTMGGDPSASFQPERQCAAFRSRTEMRSGGWSTRARRGERRPGPGRPPTGTGSSQPRLVGHLQPRRAGAIIVTVAARGAT